MSEPNTPTVKFLLVDDREDNLLVLEALLQREGLELLTARSGDEALELLLAHDVALALLDVQMPEMDGFALAEMMRGSERSKHVPIIFVTAGAHDQHRVFRGYDAGAVDFLVKPIDPRVLRQKTDTFYQLYKQRQTLAETLRLNETFVAAIGHDLKNPLNAIIVGTELILATSHEPQTRRAAERLRSSGRRMAHMIEDLSDLARARLGGGLPIERKHVDLFAIVQRVVAEHESGNRILRLQHEGNAEGDWDGGALERVVSNLVGNAVRHGDPEEPIDVVVSDEDDHVCVSIHNGGCIPPNVLPHVFGPFRSADERRVGSEGLGLGLYIVDQLVRAHGGRVDVRSIESEGTTFRVRLPRRPEAPASPRP